MTTISYFQRLLLGTLLLSLSVLGVQVWQEGELAVRTSWDTVALFLQPDGKGASNHRVLKLLSARKPAEGQPGHVAEYLIEVPETGVYQMWAAMSEPASWWASPVVIQVDGQSALDASGCRWQSAPFGLPHPGRVLGWIHPGALRLERGQHRLAFVVTEPRQSDGKYVAFLDGFLLTTSEAVRAPSGYRIAPELQPSWEEILREAGSYQRLSDSLKYGHEVWQEAEDCLRTNWGGKVMLVEKNGSGASGAMYLRLYTSHEPSSAEGYYADYEISVPADGDYHLWLSLSNPGSSWSSSVKVLFDDGGQVLDTAGIRWPGRPYGRGQLGWVTPGKVRLAQGRHRVSVRVTEKRRMSPHYLSFFDGFYLCTGDFTPVPGHYRIAPNLQPSWEDTVARAGSFRELKHGLEARLFREAIADIAPLELVSEEESRRIEERLLARPLPSAGGAGALHRFGLHGMEKPFILSTDDRRRTERVFELLARAGIDTLRTAELCWHRLGSTVPPELDFTEIDFQVEMARRYGMNFMFTIGYPPASFNYDRHHLSTFRPEHEQHFRDYLRLILPKYDRYAHYWEYANEVDAPQVWWRKATAKDYARDCRIVREEMRRLGVSTPLLGLAATYSRTDRHDAKGEGRAFTRAALQEGLASSLDGFSLHYAWPLRQRPFVEFFRELAPQGASRRLVNSEEAGYSHPSDVIKLFARNLYLHGMESVYYYVSRDWIEVGNPIYGGLFDVDWRPKTRLLSLAVAADAMKTRRLVAMAEPLPGVEAYLLSHPERPDDHAIVLWLNGGAEAHGSRFTRTPDPQPVSLRLPTASVTRAQSWRLEELPFDADQPTFEISSRPVVLYCRRLPAWRRLTPQEWSQAHSDTDATLTPEANLPGQ